ncbi:MAG: protein-L-isoaspartate(D-aspartate) O-methyltransferase [Acidobacteria bacterium]|nr:protein-L-isoaspartate(D-aspartate) O-methyltransferase [Acidobacteriota bacterium]
MKIRAFLLGSILAAFAACQSQVDLENSVAAQNQPRLTLPDNREKERDEMVDRQIRARGVADGNVLRAMRKVARHRFVPEEYAKLAYQDRPLPIGLGQTISQPFIVAYMTDAADISINEKVLEIGTGSGYQAAILGELAREVYTIEIVPELAERSGKLLNELGYKNIFAKAGNGYLGWPEKAPFDAIIVTAAPDEIPSALVEQLALDGKMIIPVGTTNQEMRVITKTKNGLKEKRTMPVRFVPMTGKPTV